MLLGKTIEELIISSLKKYISNTLSFLALKFFVQN